MDHSEEYNPSVTSQALSRHDTDEQQHRIDEAGALSVDGNSAEINEATQSEQRIRRARHLMETGQLFSQSRLRATARTLLNETDIVE